MSDEAPWLPAGVTEDGDIVLEQQTIVLDDDDGSEHGGHTLTVISHEADGRSRVRCECGMTGTMTITG